MDEGETEFCGRMWERWMLGKSAGPWVVIRLIVADTGEEEDCTPAKWAVVGALERSFVSLAIIVLAFDSARRLAVVSAVVSFRVCV